MATIKKAVTIPSLMRNRGIYDVLGVKTFAVSVENIMKQYGAVITVDLDKDMIIHIDQLGDKYWIGKSYYKLVTLLSKQFGSLSVVEVKGKMKENKE